MSQTLSSALSNRPGVLLAAEGAAGSIATVVYRSRAVRPLSSAELRQMTLSGQARNRTEAVTGLLLYDEGTFYQWLEGSADGVRRIMRSIRNDPRHTGIEILDKRLAPYRVFTGWVMKLVTRAAGFATSRSDVIYPPARVIDGLRQHPDDAATFLAELAAPGIASGPAASAGPAMRRSRKGEAVPALTAVIQTTVLPKLSEHHRVAPVRRQLAADRRAAELAARLTASDQTGAFELIAEVRAEARSPLRLFGTLFEPAARVLGDRWRDDACTEVDVTIALCRMQTAVRLLGADLSRQRVMSQSRPAVLITPEPGEPHALCAALDSEVLWNAGWFPRCSYPADDGALEDALAERWFDVLDLSLSPTFRRDHWLARVSRTIARARRASINPAIMVVVGGRVFTEVTTAGAQVGADAATATSLNLDRLIMAAFERRRSGDNAGFLALPAQFAAGRQGRI